MSIGSLQMVHFATAVPSSGAGNGHVAYRMRYQLSRLLCLG